MPSPTYTWNAGAGRYVDQAGRFVSGERVRQALTAALENAKSRGRALSMGLQSGDLTLAEWQQGMRQAIKEVHLYSAAVARGGWSQMSYTDFGNLGPTIRFHYGKLDAFAIEIENGYPLDGWFLSRADLYTLSGYTSYTNQMGKVQAELGMTEEFNVLGDADHCDGCVAATDLQWQPIGTLPPPGTRNCLGRCRCHLEYR